MGDLWETGVLPDQWPSPLKQIFAQACVPYVRSRLNVRPLLGAEHTKGLLLVGTFWPGCTTLERVPDWVRELSRPGMRDSELEILADHIRHHLGNEIRRRAHRTDD